MQTLFFSSIHRWPWSRQFPDPLTRDDGAMVCGDVAFHMAGSPGLAERFGAGSALPDIWVTWDEPAGRFLNRDVPRNRRVLMVCEPPATLGFGRDYADQAPEYGVVVTPYDLGPILAPDAIQIIAPPMINWFYGVTLNPQRDRAESRMDFAALAAMPCPEKTNACAIVCSNVRYLPEHFQRVAFYTLLKNVFKDKIAFFGRGTRYIEDKREAMDGYKYAICLENNFIDNFWTEKIADAYLGYAMPIYSGCPNLQEYFPLRSFRRIDYRHPEKAVRAVAEILEADPWEKALPHIAAARQQLLWRYNLIPALARLAPALEAAERREIGTDALARIFIGRDIPVAS